MRRTRKLFIVSLACAGCVMALLVTVVLTTHLLANREMVKSFIVSKTAQATGGMLVYDRLEISFFPLPHLKARGIHLNRQDAFEATAQELSVYPRILPILKGQVSIRRLALTAPEVRVRIGPDPKKASAPMAEKGGGSLKDGVKTVIGGLFGALAAIDPGTDLRIGEGTLILASTNAPDLRISRINAAVRNDDGDLSLKLSCRSDLTGNLEAGATADIEARQAKGQIKFTGMNVRHLFLYAALPGSITTEDTQATVEADFSVTGPAAVSGRFGLQIPSLTVNRKGLKLDLDKVAVSGSVDYADKSLSLSIDSLQTAQPALELSGAASLRSTGDAGKSVIELQAAASGLDVAVAGTVTRAIAGDLQAIRTAFSVAQAGRLTNATYFAGFAIDGTRWQLTKMKASGHLTRGRIAIPGIEADLEGMNGDVIYEDQRVAFKNVSGHFKGAAFEELDAAIDWEKKSTLTISSRSVAVDAAPLHTWLTGLQGMDLVNNYIQSVSGTARLTELEISGPLTEPENWSFEISGTPEGLRVDSPLVPFEVRLSGGVITYTPGEERAAGVKIEFLDGSVVSSYQSKGIINPESVTLRIDGSMGEEAVAWLSTILPIPGRLQLKPPVELSGVNIVWSDTRTLACMGGLKTAGGVDLFADFTISPQDWQIRQIQFTDGSSQATASARKHANGMELRFTGNVEKNTADSILEDNQILSGRLEGEFRAVIDTRAPLNSSFSGKLAGEGLRIHSLTADSIDIRNFSINGSDGQLRIAPSEVSLGSSLLVVEGVMNHGNGDLTFDLNVEADRLDEDLIRALQPIGKDKADTQEKTKAASAVSPQGTIHAKAAAVTYGGLAWSHVQADVRVGASATHVQVYQADLCGISTIGALEFSPQGISLQMTPMATNASLKETAVCLWQLPVKTDARYNLNGAINLPPTRENPARFLSGQMEFSSDNGRIAHANVLMKIFSVLNVTEMFTGGKSDLTEDGYGYTKASAKAEIGGGIIHLNEILLDGNSLKITGQGTISLDTRKVDITLLAAPLKTIDRIVNKMPIINYIAGGSLISIPLRMTGPLTDIKVTSMSPSAVGKGVLNIMERTLKAPFKIVQSASEFAVEESSRVAPPKTDATPDGP